MKPLRLVAEGTLFRLRELTRRLWVRVVLFSLGGVALALLSTRIGPYLPYHPSIDLAAGSVDALLNIVATSMLAVTTFSISIMVTAYGGATSNATPRATALLIADPVAQSALAVFIGAFAFSIMGIIGLSAGAYAGPGRKILFLATIGVIVAIAWALIRWIDHLTCFGRMADIIERLETAATGAAVVAGERPAHGARRAPAPGIGPDSMALAAEETGYLRQVDVRWLERVATEALVTIQLDRAVGDFVVQGSTLARVSRPLPPDLTRRCGKAFNIGRERSFDHDMVYGLIVLSEVASRALSPSVNDPGTAIQVVRAGTRVLLAYDEARSRADASECRHVHGPDTDAALAYRAFFAPIARDGAGLLEVQLTIQDALAALAAGAARALAVTEAREAMARAMATLDRERERELLSRAAAEAR